jgi:hypothetical protein
MDYAIGMFSVTLLWFLCCVDCCENCCRTCCYGSMFFVSVVSWILLVKGCLYVLCCQLFRFSDKYFLYCILPSCYIRFTLNICSFVLQCNIHFLLFIIRRHVSASHGHLQVLQYTLQKLVLCYANFLPMSGCTGCMNTWLAHYWHPDIGKKLA